MLVVKTKREANFAVFLHLLVKDRARQEHKQCPKENLINV